MGTATVESNEDTEEYLKIKYDNNQMTINKNPIIIFILNKIPTYVATPFPPLNFNHKGKTCPINTHSEET